MQNKPDSMLEHGIDSYCSIAKASVEMFREMQKRGLDLKKALILDVGCGEGVWSRFYSEITGEPGNIIGIDTNEKRIQKALDLSSDCIGFLKQSILTFKTKEQFEIATANVVLMCIKNKQKAVNKIYNTLVHGGFFIYMDTEKEFDAKLCGKFKQLGVIHFQIPSCVFQHRMGLFQK